MSRPFFFDEKALLKKLGSGLIGISILR